jgi:hypothetical protein
MYPSEIWCGMKCITDNNSCIFLNACGHRKKYLRIFKRKQCNSIRRYIKYNGEIGEVSEGYIPYSTILNLSKLYLQTGFHCHYCGITMSIGVFNAPDSCTIEHKVSLSAGGTNHVSNLILCCDTCNWKKENVNANECVVESVTVVSAVEHSYQM